MVFNKLLKEMIKPTRGIVLKDIVENLEKFAPISLAASWDNVGLLVDPMCSKPVENILLTNDLTEEVLEEAIQKESGLIITYHPNIFVRMKSLTSHTWKERLVVQCIRNNIGIYSPHTTWDHVQGGVCDWLAKAFQFETIEPIKQVGPNRMEGSGRILSLQQAISLNEAIEGIKKLIDLPYLRLATAKGIQSLDEQHISTIGLCPGSGGSLLQDIEKADLYVTGEMQHHDILGATQRGISVILCNHSDSERGFLKEFQDKLGKMLEGNVNVFVSKCDRDPLITV